MRIKKKKHEQGKSIKRLPPTATRRVNLNKNKQKHHEQKEMGAREPASVTTCLGPNPTCEPKRRPEKDNIILGGASIRFELEKSLFCVNI